MSKEFTEAAASYFGIDPARLADSTLTSNAEGLTLHMKIRLTDDDMIGIGKRMEERRKPVEVKSNWGWSTKPESQRAAADPLMTHYHGPDNRMYRNDGTAIPPAPTKGHP